MSLFTFYSNQFIRAALPVIAIIAVFLLSAAVAKADTGIDSYVRAVEPVCKKNTEASSRVLAGVRDKVRANQFNAAARQFNAAAAELARTRAQLQAIASSPTQAEVLNRWFGKIAGIEKALRQIGAALSVQNKYLAQRRSITLMRESLGANNVVISYNFDWCRFNPARFMAV